MWLSGIYGVSLYGIGIYGKVYIPDNISGLSTYDQDRIPRFPGTHQIPGTDNLNLFWQPPVNTSGLSGYRVYRAEKEYYDLLAPIGCTENLSYIDSGLIQGNYYYYMIRSVY